MQALKITCFTAALQLNELIHGKYLGFKTLQHFNHYYLFHFKSNRYPLHPSIVPYCPPILNTPFLYVCVYVFTSIYHQSANSKINSLHFKDLIFSCLLFMKQIFFFHRGNYNPLSVFSGPEQLNYFVISISQFQPIHPKI